MWISSARRKPRARGKRMRRSLSARLRGFLRGLSSRFSSSLTRRIVVLNLGGLFALLLSDSSISTNSAKA